MVDGRRVGGDPELSRSEARLADELVDDGVIVADDPVTARLIVQELHHARRSPMFEGRRPIYGAIVTSDPDALAGADLVPAPLGLAEARTYADGRTVYLVRRPEEPEVLTLACFDQNVQYEADMVALQEATGASIVQRTPVHAVTRLFRDGQVVSWDGSSWSTRPTASALLPVLLAAAPELEPAVARGLLDLVLHRLSPTRAGATLVVHDGDDDGSFDTSSAVAAPALDLTDRRHLPPLLSALAQRDLATVVDGRGRVRTVGVGLRASEEAEAHGDGSHGMRHRSAQRWSYDHPDAVVAVVSDDGPVTVYRRGQPVLDRSAPR